MDVATTANTCVCLKQFKSCESVYHSQFKPFRY